MPLSAHIQKFALIFRITHRDIASVCGQLYIAQMLPIMRAETLFTRQNLANDIEISSLIYINCISAQCAAAILECEYHGDMVIVQQYTLEHTSTSSSYASVDRLLARLPIDFALYPIEYQPSGAVNMSRIMSHRQLLLLYEGSKLVEILH